MNKYNIVAFIPARSGSKGILNKNIKLYKDRPLFVHSINIALQCKYINSVYVSTDSEEYQKIAINNGAKVTPLRPKNISDDLSPDIDTFKFFINSFNDINEIPNIIIHLRPTYPNRTIELLNNTIETFINNINDYDSLRTIVKIKKIPYKMYYIENNNLIPYIKTYNKNSIDIIEPYNQARQLFPDTYLHNGCIDIVKSDIIIKYNLLSGNKIFPYVMDDNETNDIDDINDFNNSLNN
jgi:N-acylneuraminate cytidylyltransferase